MLVVVATQHDRAARDLVDRWSAADAHLLTPTDLSQIGWRHSVACHSVDARAVIDGTVVPRDAIRGALVRLPCVVEDDVPHVIEQDRDYVASEMTAFLVAWLAALPAPVLNRPVDGWLAGPMWRRERWLQLASELQIPVQTYERQASLATELPSDNPGCEELTTITVVGTRAIGDVDSRLQVRARELAHAASAAMLAVYFTGPDADAAFVGADVWTNVTSPVVADGILEYLQHGVGTC